MSKSIQEIKLFTIVKELDNNITPDTQLANLIEEAKTKLEDKNIDHTDIFSEISTHENIISFTLYKRLLIGSKEDDPE